jgi:hypothetical protein
MSSGSTFSMSQHGRTEPFNLQVGRGQIPYHQPVEIFGYSTAVGGTALGPLWEGLTQSGGSYVYPGSAAQLTLVSSSASDTSALSVMIMGLDSNFNLLSEVIALNGTSSVTSVNSYLRVNGLYCTNGNNVGTITAKISSTLYAQINPTIGQSQSSVYTVPKGYTFYLTSVQANANIGFTSSNYMIFAEYNYFNLANTQVYNGYSVPSSANTTLLSQSPFVQIFNDVYDVPVGHPGGTDIQYQVKSNTGGPFTASIFAHGFLIAESATSIGY